MELFVEGTNLTDMAMRAWRILLSHSEKQKFREIVNEKYVANFI
jgi:hypothetical protein